MAKKKKKNPEGEEEIQGGKKKKKGKKKLLILLLALVVIAAAAFAVIRFVLPGLNGGKEEEVGAPPKKGITAYTVGEDSVPSLDTILEEEDGQLIANRGPGKVKEDGEEVEKYTYLYELKGYAAVVDRYLDLLLGEEQGFILTDETYLALEERPELEDTEGGLLLVKASAQEGHLFQLALGWSEANNMLAVRVAVPEGEIRHPEPKEEPQPASLSDQMDTLKSMTPSRLALPGSSMSEYDIYPVEGFVTIDGMLCRRFNIYEVGKTGDIAGIIFLSGDQQHVFRMDVEDNSIITELR